MPKLTFTDEPEKSPAKKRLTHLDEGEYQVRIKDWEFKTSAKGNEMINLQLEEVDSKNFIWDYLVFTPTAQWKLKQFLPAIGKEVGESVDMDESFMNAIVGEHLWVDLGIDTYQEKTKNTVSSYLAGKERLPRRVIEDEDVPSWDKE